MWKLIEREMKKMDKEKEIKIEMSDSSCCGTSQAPCCDKNPSSCCSTSDVRNSTQYLNKEPRTNTNQVVKTESKLKLDIYVPLEACSCEWTQFMNLMFSAITPFIKYINHETRSLNSEEARALNLTGKCVIVDGQKKYTTSYALKKDLPSILKQKGLV